MGENMWVEFSADIPNRRTAQWWHTRGTLLLADQDRVPLHRYEVQRRGARKVSLHELDAAYSIAFPDSTPLNVNKKKRSPMGRFIQT